MDSVEIVGDAARELFADPGVGDQPGGDAAIAKQLEIAQRQGCFAGIIGFTTRGDDQSAA